MTDDRRRCCFKLEIIDGNHWEAGDHEKYRVFISRRPTLFWPQFKPESSFFFSPSYLAS